MKRTAMGILGIIVVLGLAASSHAATAQIAAGGATLHDGATLDISVSDAGGMAMLYNDVTSALRIDFNCVEVSSAWQLYPVPQPQNTLTASGIGSDGHAYWLSIIDRGAQPDLVSISNAPGSVGTCSGPSYYAPVQTGDFTIAAE